MEWSYPGRTPPPRLSNASLERMINMSSLHHFPPFQIKHLFTAAQTRPLAKSKKVTLTKKKIKIKIKQLLLSVTYASQHLSTLGTIATGTAFYNFVQTFVWKFFLTFQQRACLHSPAHEETLGTISSYMWFLVFFFFRMCHPNPFSTDSVMMSKVND